MECCSCPSVSASWGPPTESDEVSRTRESSETNRLQLHHVLILGERRALLSERVALMLS